MRKIICFVCGKLIESNNIFDEGIKYLWVDDERCWMCADCYRCYDGQSIQELRDEVNERRM